jgi:alpha-1,2-mannosyltransferase
MTPPESLLRNARRAAGPLLAVIAIALVFLPLSPAYDLGVFLKAGSAVLHGLRVYPRPGTAAVYSGFSFVYPYFAVWPFVPLAAVSPGLGTALFFALCSAAVIAACFMAADGDPRAAILVLSTSFTITGLQLGALSPLLFAGVVFLWRLRDRPLAFALLAAPVVACKLFLVPLLAWPLLARRYRVVAWASVAALVLLAVGFAFGPLGLPPYLRLLSALGAHEARAGFGLIGALRTAGVGATGAQAAALPLAAAMLASAYVQHRRTGDERVLFAASIVASLLLTPVLWSHYLVLLAAALLVLEAPLRWVAVLAAASWLIAPPHGADIDIRVLERIASVGAWLVIATSLLVFGYGARPMRGHVGRRSGRPHRRFPRRPRGPVDE